MTSYENLLFDVSDGIAVMTINRPESANAWNRGLNLDINDALDRIERDSSVRVVLLTGAGDRHFCAGADLKELGGETRNAPSMGRDFMFRFEEMSQPVIAVINGAAMGGGCEMTLACDFRLMAAEAKIGVPEIQFGALPPSAMQRLPRIVGMPRAKEMVLLGRHYTAEQALTMGLVTAVWPRSELMPQAQLLAQELAGLAPHAVRTGKQLVHRALDMPVANGILLGRRLSGTMATPEEAAEARENAIARGGAYGGIFKKQ